jgi:hypothetical protein
MRPVVEDAPVVGKTSAGLWVTIFTDMGTHMKTTLDVSTPLLEEAKAVAARERTTLRALVEEGLRAVLARKRSSRQFRLRDASFKGGRGLHPDFAARGGWSRLREAAYDEGRGGE